MLRRLAATVAVAVVILAAWQAAAPEAHAQQYAPLNRHFYYPYYYFPHNYWPSMGPPWPYPQAGPDARPPAYMAYPPFREPHWRYEFFEHQYHHRGAHFWLDQM